MQVYYLKLTNKLTAKSPLQHHQHPLLGQGTTPCSELQTETQPSYEGRLLWLEPVSCTSGNSTSLVRPAVAELVLSTPFSSHYERATFQVVIQ